VFYGFVGDIRTDTSMSKIFYNAISGTQIIYRLRARTILGGSFVFNNSSTNYNNTTITGKQMWSVLGEEGNFTEGYASLNKLVTSSTLANTLTTTELDSGLDLGGINGGYVGEASIAFIIHQRPSTPEAFYNLYKSTLGTGLSLP
jgi:hypothetical protein